MTVNRRNVCYIFVQRYKEVFSFFWWKRLGSRLHSLITISKALVIYLLNIFGFFPFSSPNRDSLGNCGVSTMCLETNKTTVAVVFFIFFTFMYPFSFVHCKYIWGWKVQGWKVYGWKVELKSLGLKGPGLKLGVEKSGVEMSFNRSNGPSLIELYPYVSYIKGQTKSKWFFKPMFLPKTERTNSTLLLWYLRSTCFVRFLEEIEDIKKMFRN